MTEQMKKQIDEVFRLWDNGLCPGGQVAIRQGGETIYDRRSEERRVGKECGS